MNQLTIDQLLNLAQESLSFDDPIDERYYASEVQYYPFLFLVSRALDPALIVELGTGEKGRSTAHFAFGAPNARVIGIDYNPPKSSFPYPNLEFWAADTTKMSQKVADLGIPIEMLFIDSTHTTEHLLLEYHLYYPLMKKGGIILFDDIHMSGMVAGWESLPEPKVELPNLHAHLGFGAVIVQ